MEFQFTIYSVPMLATTIVAIVGAAVALKRRHAPGAIALALAMLSVVWWTVGHALELSVVALEDKVLFAQLQYPAKVTIALFWLIFLLQYSNSREITVRLIAALSISPLITLGIVFSNHWHNLFWSQIQMGQVGSLNVMEVAYGPLFWLFLGYTYALLVIGTGIIIRMLTRFRQLHRKQIVVLLFAVTPPWLGNVITIMGVGPAERFDITPVALALSGLALLFGLQHYRVLDIIPVARDTYFDNMSDAFLILDSDGRLVDYNRRAPDLVKFTSSAPIGLPLHELAPHLSNRLRNVLEIERAHVEIWLNGGTADPVLDVTVSALIDSSGKRTGSLIAIRDISEERAERLARQNAERQYQLLVEQTPAVTYISSMDGINRVVYVSPQLRDLLGYSPEEWIEESELWNRCIHPDDYQRVRDEFEAVRAQGDTFAIEYRLLSRDGRVVWVRDEGRKLEGTSPSENRWQGLLIDFKERKHLEERLAHLAYFDPVTELPNRTSFADRLAELQEQGPSSGSTIGVLMLDLDNFKFVNDSFGHHTGDMILRDVGQRLQKALTPHHLVCRFGGDEFVILLTHLQSESEILLLTEKLSRAFDEPFIIQHHEFFTNASIGASVATLPLDPAVHLTRRADVALRAAKQRGKGYCEVYRPEMEEDSVMRLNLERDLRYAIDREELVLHYQPIVNLTSGETEEVEALVRWQHPELGLTMPGRFIPLAEESGLIIPLDRWVLREACRQMQEWRLNHNHGALSTITINLSTRHFTHPDLLQAVQNALEESQLPPESLKLEITENVMIEHSALVLQTLAQLRELGIRLSLDDFGTGFSSLSYLKKLPVDTLKIDISFIQEIATNEEDRSLVHAIIVAAKAFSLSVTAEGVETADQLAELRELHCDHGQGSYFSDPVPAGDVLTSVQDSQPTGLRSLQD
jgi:diguanylate cyclase (GGDEF)-like protein/PAS domain S-box-containing protein